MNNIENKEIIKTKQLNVEKLENAYFAG